MARLDVDLARDVGDPQDQSGGEWHPAFPANPVALVLGVVLLVVAVWALMWVPAFA